MNDNKYRKIEEIELIREKGKFYFFNSPKDKDKRIEGLKLLSEAAENHDPEANFILGDLLLKGVLKSKTDDAVDEGMKLIYYAAQKGFIQARTMVDSICEKRYEKNMRQHIKGGSKNILRDFSGKKIKINRKGLLTPIDVRLKYLNEKNILFLNTDICFIDWNNGVIDEKLINSVINGIKSWEGEYEVFGGQKLEVKIEVSTEKKYDTIYVVLVTDESIEAVNSLDIPNSWKNDIREKLKNNRSFIVSGVFKKWSSRTRKIIFLKSEYGKFNNYDKIERVIKHEFGHALGLGDLYQSTVDNYEGVEYGTYEEIDSYHVYDKTYNMVMCDRGSITNNDIEMVILAFSKNRFQNYQKSKKNTKISYALGRGN